MPKSKKNKNVPKAKRVAPRVVARGGTTVLADPRVSAWDRLLRDPCAANLSYPCYGGADSGYLLRTTDTIANFSVTGAGLTGGSVYPADLQMSVTPSNWGKNDGIVWAGAASGASPGVPGTFAISNFLTNAAIVKSYRPVAACVKWVPSGPYTSRRGVVGMAYGPSSSWFYGQAAATTGAMLSLCQDVATNGSKNHEVRWLPSAQDEGWSALNSGSLVNVGSILLILQGVDATATSATNATLNGNLEITIVWEWQPAIGTATTISPKAPLPYTTQQVLSTITDMGAYLFEGMRPAVMGGVYSGVSGAIQAGARGAYDVLTKGYSARVRRGASMPLNIMN